jgi:hypothetical protein
MSTDKKILETVFREYLDKTQKPEDGEVFVLLLNYLNHLFEDTEEEILLEDLTSYEVDDFLNFYLGDQFPDDKNIIKRSTTVLKNFLKFLQSKKLMDKDEEREWKEVLT